MKALVKLAGLALVATLAAPAFAQGDSSADADAGFHNQVAASTAVILRVPINAKGEELSDKAEMRLYNGAPVSTSGDFATAFETSTSLAGQPVLTTGADGDSSTSYGYGWSGYGNGYGGWCSQYYYSSYTPSYTYGSSSWGYSRPYYNDYYGYGYNRPGCYGYNDWRYYYYPRHW
jgi:hypothetical protein